MDLARFKLAFDPILLKVLTEKIEEARAVADPEVMSWIEYLQVLVLSGGKRLRPYLVTHMYEAAGGRDSVLINRLGVALEFFHLFALVHDDVIDRSPLRHGVATAHAYIEKSLTQQRRGEAGHIGVSQAIVMGDLLQAWSMGCMNEFSALTRQAYSHMVDEVMVGQMIDIDLMHVPSAAERITHKNLLKTARYTFVWPLRLGAIQAGKGEALESFCENYGTELGLAFQIQDDLLDIMPNGHSLQKPHLRDIQCGQPTLFTQFILDRGKKGEREALLRYFGKPLSAADEEAVTNLFLESGALAYGQKQLERHFAKAKEAVRNAPFQPDEQHRWYNLVSILEKRAS